MRHRFQAPIAARAPADGLLRLTGTGLFDGTGAPLAEPHLLSDPGRIWLVLQRGVPVAGQALTNPFP